MTPTDALIVLLSAAPAVLAVYSALTFTRIIDDHHTLLVVGASLILQGTLMAASGFLVGDVPGVGTARGLVGVGMVVVLPGVLAILMHFSQIR